jgi:acetoin utilization protein AcuB
MILHTYIDSEFPLLKNSDSIAQAIDLVENSGFRELPVLKKNKLLGVVTLNQLYNSLDEQMKVESLLETDHKMISLKESSHPFHALHIMKTHKIQALPVIDEEDNYVGVLTVERLLPFLGSNQYQIIDYGVIVLEVGTRNYSLSEISKIVEINNAIIVHSIISQEENSELLDVHLKINKSDLKEIILTFERYEYNIKSVYHQSEYEIDLREKVNAFLDYLKI